MNKQLLKTVAKSMLMGAGFGIAFFLWQAYFMKWDPFVTAISAGGLFVAITVISIITAMNASRESTAYIFDMDGTLVDSVYALESGTKKYLDSLGLSYPENIVSIITPLGYEGAAKYLQGLGVDLPVDEIVAIMKNSMLEEYIYNIPAKPHAEELLKRLSAQGNTICLLTASPHFLIKPCFKRLKLAKFFDRIWSTDDFGLIKSDEKLYIEVAKKLKKPIKRCVFIDDNPTNIRTAKNAGMRTIGIYDTASDAFVDEMKKTADKYVYSLKEI